MYGNLVQLPLETIDEDGKAPETRIADAASAREIFQKLIMADQLRNATRSKLRGLVDGNPPYNPAELRRNNQAFRTNVNFRESEAFLSLAMASFYDVFAEVPTYANIRTGYGNDMDKREDWSKIITEEFDRLQKLDKDFDYIMQLSQREMVLVGDGPLIFEDATDWRCKAIMANDLLVPDGTKSNVSDWKVALVRTRMGVDDLFEKIQDEESAKATGWNVDYVRQRIRAAMPEPYRSGVQYDWEFFQRQLRSNDITFSARSEVVLMCHVFYKEFDGKISHAIIDERDSQGFMYRKLRRFSRWEQVIHPMYYDRGDGEHHGVKGLGIKMLQAMELKNRLRCAMVDAAFARTQILFRPLNANALSKTSVVQQGPYAILPPDYEVIQQNIAGVLDAPMAVNAELENVLQGNLSQYRQSLSKPQGNPKTAFEVNVMVSQQSAIGKTQLSRYYNQLDSFFEERYNRASNPNLNPITKSDKDAIEFQRRCKERGVPIQAMMDIDFVEATRTVGQGSQFAKQQLLGSLLSLSGALPEGGKINLLKDYIAAQVGQQMVDRYLPTQIQSSRIQDQAALAVLEHASIHQSNMPIVTDTQDHVIHIDTHMAAANQAASSLQSGGNPQEIMLFMQGIGQHVQDHLQRLSTDPARRQQVDGYAQHLQELGKTIEQLGQMIQQQQQGQAQMQQAQAIQQGTDPRTAVMNADIQAKIARQNAETMANIQRQNAKTNADLSRRNAKTTADIQRANATAESDLAR
ncbi:MAG: hypothetical protein WCK04_00860 [Actinomycetes bacterium]